MIDLDFRATVKDGVRRFDLDIRFAAEVAVTVLYGPSGSGKTLTLQALAGLLTPSSGHIRFNGQAVFDSAAGINLKASRRRVGYVFQNYALFPHLTVRDNVAFGLARWGRRLEPSAAERADEVMHALEIDSLAASRPDALSGGQQQRVALARALASRPQVLLLDEPFAALNPMLRTRLRSELKQIQERFGVPMVMISHDIDDVAALADTMFVIEGGHVVREVDVQDRVVRERLVSEAGQFDPATAERRQWLARTVDHG
jgi:molybdate transport system ATP-binding protein